MATRRGASLKTIFGIDYNANDKFGAFLKAREAAQKEYNEATDKQGKALAVSRAEAVGIEEDALIKGRPEIFGPYFEKQLTRNSGLEAEKAAALTRAYNALADALETVARKADAALFDKFGAVLDRLTKWLDEDSERIVKFFTELATQIGLVFTDLAKLSPAFVLLWAALKEVGGWLQKIIGQPDAGGLAGVRHLLELISGVVMARFVAGMVAGFALAFGPVTALLTALGALGVIAYTGGWLGGGGSYGFGAGEGEESGGHGRERRGKFGHGGGGPESGRGGGGGPLTSGPIGAAGSLTALITKEAERAAIDPRIMEGIRAGESAHGSKYDVKDDSQESSWGPFQLNRRRGLGVEFERDTATQRAKLGFGDLRDPRTIPLQARWVAEYLKKHHGDTSPWMGYHGLREANPNWGESGYSGHEVIVPHVAPASNPIAPPPATDFHKALETIRSAKPLAPWQHSMNEIHDYRSVDNDVNIQIAIASADLTTRPLSRPKNADLIRNTTSYTS